MTEGNFGETAPLPVTPNAVQHGMRRRVGVGAVLLAAGSLVGTTAALLQGEGPDPNSAGNGFEPTVIDTEGISDQGTEFAYHIAGQGSCSPYTRADGRRVASGEFAPEIDLVDVESKFLEDNPGFAANYGKTSEPRIGYLFDALKLDRPSEQPDKAAELMRSVFEDEFYVTAPLANDTLIQNTFCDEEGNVKNYRVVALEAGTYVGGVMIERQYSAPDGQTVTELKNGQTVILPNTALIADVKLEDGTAARMLATHKAGVNSDKDFEAEVACLNVITVVPPSEQPPATVPPEITPTTEQPTPTTKPPKRPQPTTTTAGVTTTTSVEDKHPQPLPGAHTEPGDGGNPEEGMDPENDSDEDGYGPGDSRPADSDGDGFFDVTDACPTAPETFNGFQDNDGCPDSVPPTTGPTPTTGPPRSSAPPASVTTIVSVPNDTMPPAPTN